MKIDAKRHYQLEVERHDMEWWSVHVSNEDELMATLSARELGAALTAAAAVVEREIALA